MWHHNKQSSFFEDIWALFYWLWGITAPPSGKPHLLLCFNAFIFCSLYKMSKLFPFQYFAWATLVQVCVFPGPVEPQAKLRQMGSRSLSWAPREASSLCLPLRRLLTNQLRSNWNFPFWFFFFLTTGKVLSPQFSQSYPFLNFTLNHSGGKGIAEVRKYGKNVSNVPLKYTLRIFSASIISTLNF